MLTIYNEKRFSSSSNFTQFHHNLLGNIIWVIFFPFGGYLNVVEAKSNCSSACSPVVLSPCRTSSRTWPGTSQQCRRGLLVPADLLPQVITDGMSSWWECSKESRCVSSGWKCLESQNIYTMCNTTFYVTNGLWLVKQHFSTNRERPYLTVLGPIGFYCI